MEVPQFQHINLPDTFLEIWEAAEELWRVIVESMVPSELQEYSTTGFMAISCISRVCPSDER